MKHYIVIEETKKVKTLLKTTCDICRSEIKDFDGFDASEVELSHRRGTYYSSGEDFTEIFQLDVCGECFETKITPFLESLGVKVEYIDYIKW